MNTTTTTTATLITCPKCHGVGNFPTFRHIVGGTCFRCGGTGKSEETIREYRPRAAHRFIPNASTPYAVVCTDEAAVADGAGGRIGGNLSWDGACAIVDRMTECHGVSYEIVKFVDGEWVNRAGDVQII